MIRFIDLRHQGTYLRFAWWDTRTNRFLEFAGEQAWSDWSDFEQVYDGTELARFRGLCPDWAHQPWTEADEARFWADDEPVPPPQRQEQPQEQ